MAELLALFPGLGAAGKSASAKKNQQSTRAQKSEGGRFGNSSDFDHDAGKGDSVVHCLAGGRGTAEYVAVDPKAEHAEVVCDSTRVSCQIIAHQGQALAHRTVNIHAIGTRSRDGENAHIFGVRRKSVADCRAVTERSPFCCRAKKTAGCIRSYVLSYGDI